MSSAKMVCGLSRPKVPEDTDPGVIAMPPRTTISSLPNEVLTGIFNNVKNSRHGRIEDIKSVRLTCRQFYNNSSHLLVDTIRVFLSQQGSFDRLVEISNHPAIRTGVKTIYLYMDYYGSNVALNAQLFARFCRQKVSVPMREWHTDYVRNMQLLKHMKLQERPAAIIEAKRAEVEEFKQILGRALRYKVSWRLAEQHGFDNRLEDHILLRSSYMHYRKSYFLQIARLPHCVSTIATAMAKMPFARQLIVYEGPGSGLFDRIDDADMGPHALIWQKLIAPVTNWQEGEFFGAGPPPARMLIDLPVSLHQAGVELKSLEMHLSPSADLFYLHQSDQEREHLQGATRRLQSFHFELLRPCDQGIWYIVVNDHEHWPVLRKYLSSLTSSAALEYFNTQLEILDGGRFPPVQPSPGVGMMFEHEWPRLKYYEFHGPFRFEELKGLIESRAGRKKLPLHLYGHLVSESWEQLLDVARNRVAPSSTINMDVTCTAGADWEDLNRRQRGYLKEKTVEFGGYFEDRATAYARGAIENNPMREVNEEEAASDDPDEETDSEDSEDSEDEEAMEENDELGMNEEELNDAVEHDWATIWDVLVWIP